MALESSETAKTKSEEIREFYGLKEAFVELSIGATAGREWIALYELLTTPLPRSGNLPNSARMVSREVIEHIRAARSLVAQNTGTITAEDALRTVLKLELSPIPKRRGEYTPQDFAEAVSTALQRELEPLRSQIQSLEQKIIELNQQNQKVLELKASPRENTFLSKLKKVFSRGD
jgi:hypothetical protein